MILDRSALLFGVLRSMVSTIVVHKSSKRHLTHLYGDGSISLQPAVRQLQDPQLQRLDHRLGAVRDYQLLDYVFDVVLRGAWANHQLPGDLAVGMAQLHQLKDLLLARGQRLYVQQPPTSPPSAAGDFYSLFFFVGQPPEQPSGDSPPSAWHTAVTTSSRGASLSTYPAAPALSASKR